MKGLFQSSELILLLMCLSLRITKLRPFPVLPSYTFIPKTGMGLPETGFTFYSVVRCTKRRYKTHLA